MSNQTRQSIDLNADLGEGMPWDSLILSHVTSASICCGAHASDPATIQRTLEIAQNHQVQIGAHPGYADRIHFGRKELTFTTLQIRDLILNQIDDLERIAQPLGITINFLKPHGALYNQAQQNPQTAEGVLQAAAQRTLPVLGMPSSQIALLAEKHRVTFIPEGFSDRRYASPSRLVPRSEPNAVLDDPQEVAAQTRSLIDQGVQTLCIHGDHPHAPAQAQQLALLARQWGLLVLPFATKERGHAK